MYFCPGRAEISRLTIYKLLLQPSQMLIEYPGGLTVRDLSGPRYIGLQLDIHGILPKRLKSCYSGLIIAPCTAIFFRT